MSSPNLNNLIIIGCVLSYTSVIILGLDSTLTSQVYQLTILYPFPSNIQPSNPKPANHPTIQPSNHPAIQLYNHPTIQLSNNPNIQPSNPATLTIQAVNHPNNPTL